MIVPAPGYEIGERNRRRVFEYFIAHVGCTNKECAAALGLSTMAVGRHVASLREEWGGSASQCPQPRRRRR